MSLGESTGLPLMTKILEHNFPFPEAGQQKCGVNQALLCLSSQAGINNMASSAPSSFIQPYSSDAGRRSTRSCVHQNCL